MPGKKLRFPSWWLTGVVMTIALSQIPVKSQLPPGTPEAEAQLTEAVTRYEADLHRLYNVKGFLYPAHEASDFFDIVAAPRFHDVRFGAVSDGHPLQSLRLLLTRDYPPGTALLFYSFKGDDLQVWLVDASGIRGYARTPTSRQDLNTAIVGLRQAIGVDSAIISRAPRRRGVVAVGIPAVHRPAFGEAVSGLSRVLLPPALADGLSSVKRLLVVPVQGIGTVPFPLLQLPGKQVPLIDLLPVSVLPSLFDLAEPVRPWSFGFRSALVVGNPSLVDDPEWVFPPLPEAEREARDVARLLRTNPLIGPEATKRSVLARGRKADFLYFATHGVADEKNALHGSFLVLAPERNADGRWTDSEIQFSHLGAQIAVLSACQTGLGQLHDAGIIGLSRAFQQAGVPRVVMSLWSVPDRSTAVLMENFVRRLRVSLPDEALRQAMYDTRRLYPDPLDWASFAYFGTPR